MQNSERFSAHLEIGLVDVESSNLRWGAPSFDCDWTQPNVAGGAAFITCTQLLELQA